MSGLHGRLSLTRPESLLLGVVVSLAIHVLPALILSVELGVLPQPFPVAPLLLSFPRQSSGVCYTRPPSGAACSSLGQHVTRDWGGGHSEVD